MYKLDAAKCFSAPWLAWEAALKKIKVILDFLTKIDMLLMVEKDIREGTWYANANNKYIKDFNKNK